MFAASHPSNYSSAGKLISLITAAEIAAGIFLLAHPMPAMSAPLFGAMLGMLGASVFVLCRVAIPNPVRAPLILLLMAILMALAVHADLLGLRKVSDKVADATKEEAQSSLVADASGAAAGSPVSRQSAIRLQASSGGDHGWAQRINDAAARDLGPPGAATISGYVSVEADAAGDRLRVNWSIDQGPDTIPCGLLTIRVTNPEFALGQITRSFRAAMERSAQAGGPRCN